MLFAGKAVAGTIMCLFENPNRLAKAWEEFEERTAGGIYLHVPDGVKPPIAPRG